MGSGEIVPGRCKGITCYAFDGETGRLTRLSVTPSVPNPSYILVHPDAPFLYCVNELKEYGGRCLLMRLSAKQESLRCEADSSPVGPMPAIWHFPRIKDI